MKVNDRRGLNRRELTGFGLAFSLAAPTISIVAAPSAAAAEPEAPAGGSIAAIGAQRSVKFRDGAVAPALGQGSARLGQGRHPETVEEEALREGISLGMTLIDTAAEIYGNGDAEKLIGRAIADQRERAFLVSKVWPTHGGREWELNGRARGVSRASGLTISIFTCCIGQTGLPMYRAW